jgi:hypothetical protein
MTIESITHETYRQRLKQKRRRWNSRARALYKLSNYSEQVAFPCFYTGQICYLNAPNGPTDPWLATVEHLIAKCDGGSDDQSNLVIAASFVNSLVANAPLFVKFDVKENLKKLKFFPGVSPETKQKIIKNFIRSILSGYKIPGIKYYPWSWKSSHTTEHSQMLKDRNDYLIEMSANIVFD